MTLGWCTCCNLVILGPRFTALIGLHTACGTQSNRPMESHSSQNLLFAKCINISSWQRYKSWVLHLSVHVLLLYRPLLLLLLALMLSVKHNVTLCQSFEWKAGMEELDKRRVVRQWQRLTGWFHHHSKWNACTLKSNQVLFRTRPAWLLIQSVNSHHTAWQVITCQARRYYLSRGGDERSGDNQW